MSVMIRALLTGCLVAVVSTSAWADRVTLDDGRTFTGVVTVENDTVTIETSYAILSFPQSKVANILFEEIPEVLLAQLLEKIPEDDPEALFALAKWADENSLTRQAQDICETVLAADADHAGARQMLGYVKIDGTWQPFDKALELARSKLAAGKYAYLLKELLPSLKELAQPGKQYIAVLDLLAETQLRAG
ncbi:MAG: hypothetical protein KAU28_00995, partial [Phycisphaerae bacterium]|nr:hypothetical protein [Phycisphaerae bacterium]